jgi:hypothetical protein
MNELDFKYRLAIAHFLSHSVVIVLCLAFIAFNKLNFPEAVPILSVVAPILAVYAPDITRFILESKYRTSGRRRILRKSFVTFAVIVFVISHGIIYASILVYVFTAVMTPSQFQTAFGTIEVFFAAYMGALIRSLYKDDPATS